MAEIGTAYVALLPSAKGFGSAVQKELGPAGTQAGGTASKGFRGTFLKGLAGMGTAMVGMFAIDKVTDFFTSSVEEARESQKVNALTTQVIKSTGGAAQVSAKQVGDLATAISNKTGIDDEAVQSGANLLLTFKNIKDEAGAGNNIFDQTTQIMTDMSAAMGKDPKAAAIGLGKALNDPVKGIAALSRVGVQFDADQTNLIKKLVESGDTMGAQKVILHELKSEFGGAAAASSTAGEKAAVSWGNLKEQIGTALLPTIDKLEGFLSGKIIPAVSTFLGQMQSGKGAGGDFADALHSIWSVLQAVWPILANIGKWLLNNLPVVYAIAAAIMAWYAAQLIFNAVQAIQLAMLMIVTPGTFLYAVASGIAAAATAVWAAAVWLLTTPLGLLVLAIVALIVIIILVIKYHRQIGAFIAKAWNKIKEVVSKAVSATVDWIKARWSAIISWLRGIGPKITAGLKNMWEGAKNAFLAFGAWERSKISDLVSFILSIPGKIAALGAKLLSVGKEIGGKLISGIFAGLQAAGGFVGDLVDSIKGAINDALHLPFTIHGPGPLPDFTIPHFATGGRVKGSYFLAGERGWESIIPDKLMVQALTAAASSGAGAPARGPERLRLVVDGYEFNAYVDARADRQVASSGQLDAERGRAQWQR